MQTQRKTNRRGVAYSSSTSKYLLYGMHTVKFVLANPRRTISAIYATQSACKRLQNCKVQLPLNPRIVDMHWFKTFLGNSAVHQGIAVEVEPLKTCNIEALANAKLVLALDAITDPHNVGAIFRSAAAFGVDAVITTTRHSPKETGILAKAASGATEIISHVRVLNLADALRQLRLKNFLIIGLDSRGAQLLEDAGSITRCVLLLGAEGKGIQSVNQKECSLLARLKLPGKLQSLNVSNAAALSLHIVTQCEEIALRHLIR